ncbi:hypothetical protein B0H19DRAFT_1322472, partial [Mycena capillaripes]
EQTRTCLEKVKFLRTCRDWDPPYTIGSDDRKYGERDAGSGNEEVIKTVGRRVMAGGQKKVHIRVASASPHPIYRRRSLQGREAGTRAGTRGGDGGGRKQGMFQTSTAPLHLRHGSSRVEQQEDTNAGRKFAHRPRLGELCASKVMRVYWAVERVGVAQGLNWRNTDVGSIGVGLDRTSEKKADFGRPTGWNRLFGAFHGPRAMLDCTWNNAELEDRWIDLPVKSWFEAE